MDLSGVHEIARGQTVSGTPQTGLPSDDNRPVLALNPQNLEQLQGRVHIPKYNPKDVKASIVHIGPGAFFRAHFAVLMDNVLNAAAENGQPLKGGIVAVSMKNGDVRNALKPQDGLYTVTTKGNGDSTPRVIGSVRDYLVARDNPAQVIDLAASADIEIITLTVTQKGYYYDHKKGFNFENPEIVACLDESSPEISAIGLLVSVMQRRMDARLKPPIIVSLDNLSGNGTTLKNAVLAYAAVKSPELRKWIADNAFFPNTMVDRITPRTTPESVAEFTEHNKIIESWPIQAEKMPKLPWVVEKIEGCEYPDYIKQIAIISPNINPYEELKVRTLNGVHLALGCIGTLSGYKFSHEAMADPQIRQFAIGFMEEAGTTLHATDGLQHSDFRSDVVQRLDNDKICDQLTRLSRNGTTKLSSRLLDTIRDVFASGKDVKGAEHLSFALAAWIEYAKALNKDGRLPTDPPKEEPNDSNAAKIGLTNIIYPDMVDPSPVFSLQEVFGYDMSQNQALIASVKQNLELIHNNGINKALDMFLTKTGNPNKTLDFKPA